MRILKACPSCGSMAPENATSCKFCGADIDPFTPEQTARSLETNAHEGAEGENLDRPEPQHHPHETSTSAEAPGTPSPTSPIALHEEADVDSEPDEQSTHSGDGSSPWARPGSLATADSAEAPLTQPVQPRTPPPATAPHPPSEPAPAKPTNDSGLAASASRGGAGGPATDPAVGGGGDDRADRWSEPLASSPHAHDAPSGPHVRAVRPPRRTREVGVATRIVRAGIVFLLVVVAGVLLVIVGGQFNLGPIGKQKEADAGRGDWVTYTDPRGLFSVQMPTEPAVDTAKTSWGAPWQTITSRAATSTYEVQTVDHEQGIGGVYAEQWLEEQPGHYASAVDGKVTSTKRTALHGHVAIEWAVSGGDGWQHRGLTAVYGARTYIFVVSSRSDAPAGLERMIQTFTPMSPGES